RAAHPPGHRPGLRLRRQTAAGAGSAARAADRRDPSPQGPGSRAGRDQRRTPSRRWASSTPPASLLTLGGSVVAQDFGPAATVIFSACRRQRHVRKRSNYASAISAGVGDDFLRDRETDSTGGVVDAAGGERQRAATGAVVGVQLL